MKMRNTCYPPHQRILGASSARRSGFDAEVPDTQAEGAEQEGEKWGTEMRKRDGGKRGRQAGEYAELKERAEPVQHKCQTPTAPGVAGVDLGVNHLHQPSNRMGIAWNRPKKIPTVQLTWKSTVTPFPGCAGRKGSMIWNRGVANCIEKRETGMKPPGGMKMWSLGAA
ncbi:hypothetical protein AMECASPLE_009276 [Ameca splendens]|uniref:Uncharacterized protein n=1 Tax=Ameca splendens TaxID=208324 RepID=A0ABV0XD98_9TELE